MSYRTYCDDCVQRLAKLEENSIDSIVTDPPYGLKFMGKEFDDLGEGAQQREWHKRWAEEAYRVLKPGGYLIAFGGTRTYHHLATAVEEAGFEIRDQIQWLYGSGFPKSLNVGKAIDKRGGETVSWFGPWFRDWRKKNKITQKEVAALFPSKTGRRTGCVANWELGLNLPTPEQFNKIVKAFDLPFSNIEEAEREVVKKDIRHRGSSSWEATGGMLKEGEQDFSITAPATEAAKEWEGWGTALKPANEPCVLARKPFKGTVAENVQEWGTGALNIDGCRVGSDDTRSKASMSALGQGSGWNAHKNREVVAGSESGRWPANVILDEEAGAQLDEQSGTLKSGANPTRRNSNVFGDCYGHFEGQEECVSLRGADQGGASRFFYCPKAAKKERNAGLDKFEKKEKKTLNDYSKPSKGRTAPKNGSPQRNNHPTVKPIELMRYLIRLVTPPGGTVLDPFLGSGSTGCAALLEGFDFIGIDMNQEYIEIARARMKYWKRNA